MPDLYIFCVTYEHKTHIEHVRMVESIGILTIEASIGCLDNLNKIGKLYTRQQIIDLIKTNKKEIYTAYYDIDLKKWREGDLVTIFSEKFIRTDGDSIEEDNLGEICNCNIVK